MCTTPQRVWAAFCRTALHNVRHGCTCHVLCAPHARRNSASVTQQSVCDLPGATKRDAATDVGRVVNLGMQRDRGIDAVARDILVVLVLALLRGDPQHGEHLARVEIEQLRRLGGRRADPRL